MKFGSSKKDDRETTPVTRTASTQPSPDSVIGAGMTIDGSCSTNGALRVDGRVTGDVRARSLVVGEGGVIEGDATGSDGSMAGEGAQIEGRIEGAVHASRAEVGEKGHVGNGLRVEEATVRGRIHGEVMARKRLMIEASAVIEGDVSAAKLGVREGGRVSGLVRIGRVEDRSEGPRGADSAGDGTGSGAGANAKSGAGDGSDAKAKAGAGSVEKKVEPAG